MDDFLSICEKHHIKPLFCIFDDCWNAESSYGKQPDPKPGVHNSGWVQDPAVSLRKDTLTLYPKMEKYVKDLLTTFGKDERILLWDLWNEPGNRGHVTEALPMLKRVFQWAREANPSQPVTSGIWNWGDDFAPLNAFQLENSDVVSYHNYSDRADHEQCIKYLKMFNRPLVCTEYMARRNNSFFSTIMPLLKENKVVAINWGFVAGKTNTIFAWDEPLPDVAEPKLWFHDIFRQDANASASVVPLAFPLLAGPASFTTILSLRAEYDTINVVLALVLNMLIVFFVLRSSSLIYKLIGESGMYVLKKFFGIIVLAISVRLFTNNLAILIHNFSN